MYVCSHYAEEKVSSPFCRQSPIWLTPFPWHLFSEPPTFGNTFLTMLHQWNIWLYNAQLIGLVFLYLSNKVLSLNFASNNKQVKQFNVYSPRNHQKNFGFVMISGEKKLKAKFGGTTWHRFLFWVISTLSNCCCFNMFWASSIKGIYSIFFSLQVGHSIQCHGVSCFNETVYEEWPSGWIY